MYTHSRALAAHPARTFAASSESAAGGGAPTNGVNGGDGVNRRRGPSRGVERVEGGHGRRIKTGVAFICAREEGDVLQAASPPPRQIFGPHAKPVLELPPSPPKAPL